MAAGAFQTYEPFVEYVEKNIIELTADTFYAALFLSTSNANVLTHDVFGDLTNEHAAANGYVAGGVALTGVTAARTGRIIKFDCDDIVFNAVGGSIQARYLVIYKLGTVGAVVNPLVAVCVLDSTPADVIVSDGNPLTIIIAANGVLTIGGGS